MESLQLTSVQLKQTRRMSQLSSVAFMCAIIFVPPMSPPEVFACFLSMLAVVGSDAWECWNLSHMFGFFWQLATWPISTHTSSDLLCFWAELSLEGPQRGVTWEGIWGRHRNGGLICCRIGGAQHAPLRVLLALVCNQNFGHAAQLRCTFSSDSVKYHITSLFWVCAPNMKHYSHFLPVDLKWIGFWNGVLICKINAVS